MILCRSTEVFCVSGTRTVFNWVVEVSVLRLTFFTHAPCCCCPPSATPHCSSLHRARSSRSLFARFQRCWFCPLGLPTSTQRSGPQMWITVTGVDADSYRQEDCCVCTQVAHRDSLDPLPSHGRTRRTRLDYGETQARAGRAGCLEAAAWR